MSFDFSQFEGIHHVAKKPERVWVHNAWSIEVPTGYSYSVDPETAGSGAAGGYLLHVQDSRDCDLSVSYGSRFNFAVYGSIIDVGCRFDDMSSPEFLDAMEDQPTHRLLGYDVYKCSKDLAIFYGVRNETEEYTMYDIQVVVRGLSIGFLAQFNTYDGTIDERKKRIFRWIDSIDTLTEEERLSFRDYSGTSKSTIPVKFRNETALIGEGIRISIPEGFRFETNPGLIGEGRRLVIVPDDYRDLDDPMEAPIGLSVQSGVISGFPTDIQSADLYHKFLCSAQANVFKESTPVIVCKHSETAFSLSQKITNDEDFIKTDTALFANGKSYGIHLIINYWAYQFDYSCAEWDIDHLCRAWLGRIQIDGESAPNYPSRSQSITDRVQVKAATPSKVLYPHYDQLGDTSVPQKRAGATFITNPGGTEFECYPLAKINGELGDACSRACSKDACGADFRLLVSKAKNYAALFRVNPNVFNPKQDRECDIRNLNMRRAYQLHVLRSFAWTLADWAESQKMAPADVSFDDYQKILSFVEQRKYLNYQADSHYPTLCGTADLHVFFVPEKLSSADKKVLGDNENLFGNIIPHSIASIEGLRKDLLALSGPMEKLFGSLLNNRDYSTPLTGTGADALYAWCCMVLAAETPFFIEDGPMNCFYSQFHEPQTPALEKQRVDKSAKASVARKSSASAESKGTTAAPPKRRQSGMSTGKRSTEGLPKKAERIIAEVYQEQYRAAAAIIQPLEHSFPVGTMADDDDLNEIGDTLFDYTGMEEHVTLPRRIKALSSSVFDGPFTESVYLPDSVEEIGNFVFSSCSSLRHVRLPPYLKKMGENLFYECSSLQYVSLPKSMSKLPEGMFSNCSELEAMIVPEGCTIIGKGAFESCSSLKYVVLPKTLKSIERDAFNECCELETILIPDGCQKIGKWAFFECTSLRDAYIPASVTEIDDMAFDDTDDLTIHTVRNSAADQWANRNGAIISYDIDPVELVHDDSSDPAMDEALSDKVCKVVNRKVVRIKAEDEWESTIKVPVGVRSIGTCAFENIRSTFGAMVELPEGLEEIEEDAFHGCVQIKTIVIPPTVRKIDKNAVSGVGEDGLTIDCVAGSAAEQFAIDNGFRIVCDKASVWNGRACRSADDLIQALVQKTRQKSLADAVRKDILKVAKEVTITAANAFQISDRKLDRYTGRAKTIKIPDGITAIGYWAFVDAGAKKAEKIVFPASVTEVELKDGFPPEALLIGPDTPFLRYCFESAGNPFEFQTQPEDEKYLTAIKKKVAREEARVKKEEQARMEAEARAKAEAEEKARAEAEAAERARAEAAERERAAAEKALMEQISEKLKQNFSGIYRPDLTRDNYSECVNWLTESMTSVCNQEMWETIRRLEIDPLPPGLPLTRAWLATENSGAESYSGLPQKIAAEYITQAETKRNEGRFRSYLEDLNALAQKRVLPLFEDGMDKSSVIRWFQSGAKAIVGDGKVLSEGLVKFRNVPEIRTLHQTLGVSGLDSLGQILDVIGEKAGAEYDRLSAALKKRNADLEAVEVEAANLKLERSRLGLFQGKRKREIDELLETIPERIQQIEEEYEKAKTM